MLKCIKVSFKIMFVRLFSVNADCQFSIQSLIDFFFFLIDLHQVVRSVLPVQQDLRQMLVFKWLSRLVKHQQVDVLPKPAHLVSFIYFSSVNGGRQG